VCLIISPKPICKIFQIGINGYCRNNSLSEGFFRIYFIIKNLKNKTNIFLGKKHHDPVNAAVSPINLSFISAITSLVNRVEVSTMSRKKSIIIGQMLVVALLFSGESLAQDNETEKMGIIDGAQTL